MDGVSHASTSSEAAAKMSGIISDNLSKGIQPFAILPEHVFVPEGYEGVIEKDAPRSIFFVGVACCDTEKYVCKGI